jgi:hypothetical protein
MSQPMVSRSHAARGSRLFPYFDPLHDAVDGWAPRLQQHNVSRRKLLCGNPARLAAA